LSYVLVAITKSESQDFRLVSEKKIGNNDTSLIYHYADRRDGLTGADLYMYANGSFFCKSYTDLAYWISVGTWIRSGDTFSFTSDLKNRLPILVSYVSPQTETKRFKNFAIIKDLTGREYTHGAIHVNNDSVSCFYGDMECVGSYKAIDSIRITIKNDVTSCWIKVDSTKGVIQVIVQTDIDLERYFPFNVKLRRESNTLKLIDE